MERRLTLPGGSAESFAVSDRMDGLIVAEAPRPVDELEVR